MPALPSVPNVLRIDWFFDLQEDLHAKTRAFWKYLSGPPTNAELAAMATGLRIAFSSDVASLMHNVYSLIGIVVTDLTSPTSATGSDSTPVAGTRTSNQLSADVCVLESRHVARRYRGGHSRIYWPFFASEDIHDGQTWVPDAVTEATTKLNTYGAAIDSAISVWGTSDGPVNVSYYEGFTTHTGTTGRVRNVSTPRAVPVVDPVIGSTIQHGIAVQRKRLLRLA